MRATVNRRFFDRVKNTLHEAGSEVTLTSERFEELSSKGYVTELAEETPAQKEDQGAGQRLTKEEKATRRTK